jgi:hypothetical protein
VSEFGSQATQQFSNASDALELGDPMNNIFIINLPLGRTWLILAHHLGSSSRLLLDTVGGLGHADQQSSSM